MLSRVAAALLREERVASSREASARSATPRAALQPLPCPLFRSARGVVGAAGRGGRARAKPPAASAAPLAEPPPAPPPAAPAAPAPQEEPVKRRVRKLVRSKASPAYGASDAENIWRSDAPPPGATHPDDAQPPHHPGSLSEPAGAAERDSGAAGSAVAHAESALPSPSSVAPSDAQLFPVEVAGMLLPPPVGSVVQVSPGASFVTTLRDKFRSRRERSLSRVAAQLQQRGASEESVDATPETADQTPDNVLRAPAPGERPTNAIDWRTLTAGEFVVHKTYGVGEYLGTRKLSPREGEGETDYLFIKYADATAKLRATSASRLLYRYRMPGETKGKAPRLNSLSEPATWRKKQAKSLISLAKVVYHLMDSYLERVMVTRPAYPELDAQLMAAFSASFPYPLTTDQAGAVSDIFGDMGNDTPMDRLVVGDVGFGKTEVAMHAALRALASGKQVIVLAPTTVLARQHAMLFEKRMEPLGFRCSSVTRFNTAPARRATVAGLADGTVHLVVGTHALLSEASACANLGLLIVDEEQRFGVRHKETIKALHTRLDVLTLSATPIPRTLHMALAGFRDASIISTPPPGRRPINTTLTPSNDALIKEAISKELARGGQVFYVVPRIEAMEERYNRLAKLLPGLRVQQAHGKMKPNVLEEAMESFADAEFDVLLCTTIVESGLDLPRVNTIIIEDVHMFGLSSLYQLRGRVGRADLQAYAYLFWEPHVVLGEEAIRRLDAVRECCGLGMGFRIAERDMAIRGVGAVFGDKQSGEAAGVGADLYLEMLFDQLKGVEHQRLPVLPWDEVDIRLSLRGLVPPGLVGSEADARQLATRALEAGRSGPAALKALAAEVERVTGAPIPKPFHSLLRGHLLRWYASEMCVHGVDLGEVGVIYLRTRMGEATFRCIEGLLAEPDRATLKMMGAETVAIKVSVPTSEAPSWALQPDMHVERAISALAAMHAAAPKFLRYV